jgi:hypothetical protein
MTTTMIARSTITPRIARAAAAALTVALFAQPAAAQKVHRCVDEKGGVTFSDKRCQTGEALRSPITASATSNPIETKPQRATAAAAAEPAELANVAARLNERALR